MYENGDDMLIVYSDVPGLEQPEAYYKIRVRSNASKNEWKDCFGLVTRSLYTESNENYFSHLEGWTHTYANIEMNSTVEVEIAKADGSPITKAAVHPTGKSSIVTITDGKAYFTMDQPALIAVDINGQMDDNDTGRDPSGQAYDGPPVHAVSLFAHPMFNKPDSTSSDVKVIHPGEAPPADPATFKTLYFAPGVHNIGKDYQVHKNRSYYIPGDAIVYGTFGNHEADNGMNIHIFGLGTISGDSLKHPEFDPDFPGYPDADADPINGRPWKSISIIDSEYTHVEGVCIANPAFHALSLPTSIRGPKVTTVRWSKVISWRGNGDGFGNPHIVEDCFLRTQDDSFYVKGDRRRCVIWNDANGAAFVMSSIPDYFPIVIEDCDIIYARASWHMWSGGRVFSGRPISGEGNKQVNVLFRDIRIEDKRPTLQIFYVLSKNDISSALIGTPNETTGSSWSGIKFQNITSAGKSVVGHPEIFHGCAESPYSDWTFDNFVIDGKLFTSLDDFAEVNEYVTDITFNPGIIDDATLFDLRIDGVSIQEFSPATEQYSRNLPLGTIEAPVVSATASDYGATVSIVQAETIPGTALVEVTAEDGITKKNYSVNFTAEGSDELISIEAPGAFSPGDTILVTVKYAATDSRDIQVLLKNENDNITKYGENRVTVPMGTGTEEIDLIVAATTPLAKDIYKVTVNLLPVGGPFSEVLDIKKIFDLDIVSPYSSDATLSDLKVNGKSVPGFDPQIYSYDIELPAGTGDIPLVEAITSHENALDSVFSAAALPGTTTVKVIAEDGITTINYTLNFTVALPDEITGLTAPNEFSPGDTIVVSVAYSANAERDLIIVLQSSFDPFVIYGSSTVSVSRGSDTIVVECMISGEIPVADGAYTILARIVPAGGTADDAYDEASLEGLSVNSGDPSNLRMLENPDSGIRIYPNPFSSEIHVLNTREESFVIYNILGHEVFTSTKVSEIPSIVLGTHELGKGIYILLSESGTCHKIVKH